MVAVFLLGATGFLGGTVLIDLEKNDYEVTALVRQGKEKLLENLRVKIVTASRIRPSLSFQGFEEL